jgi:hypothetical protein
MLTARTARLLVSRWIDRSSIRVVQVAKGEVTHCTTTLPTSMPNNEMTVSWLESFALSSPRLPQRAKCALRLALAEPAATPQRALSTLLKLRISTLRGFGKAGERQSSTKAKSFKMSASKRYILHSGSRDVPNLQANRIVATRPADSWMIDKINAAVGEAEESPTPTLDSTARDDRSPAMELENACRESLSPLEPEN